MVMRPGVFEIMKAVFYTQDSIKLSEKADAIICYVSIFVQNLSRINYTGLQDGRNIENESKSSTFPHCL